MEFKRIANTKAEMRALLDPSKAPPTEFKLESFGTFGKLEIHSIIDNRGNYWFTQDVVAEAIGVDPSTVSRARTSHAGEFEEFEHYMNIRIDHSGKMRLCYSEEGFLMICDLITTAETFRLKKWIRTQFRVKQTGGDITVHTKSLPEEDFSDLPEELQRFHLYYTTMMATHQRIKKTEVQLQRLEVDKAEIISEQKELRARVDKWEEGAKIKPGEMTSEQLATSCGWRSRKGHPHFTAVILAAANEGFEQRGLMNRRHEMQVGIGQVERVIFTAEGVKEFKSEIDSRYAHGAPHTIEPVIVGYTSKRNFYKV